MSWCIQLLWVALQPRLNEELLMQTQVAGISISFSGWEMNFYLTITNKDVPIKNWRRFRNVWGLFRFFLGKVRYNYYSIFWQIASSCTYSFGNAVSLLLWLIHYSILFLKLIVYLVRSLFVKSDRPSEWRTSCAPDRVIGLEFDKTTTRYSDRTCR